VHSQKLIFELFEGHHVAMDSERSDCHIGMCLRFNHSPSSRAYQVIHVASGESNVELHMVFNSPTNFRCSVSYYIWQSRRDIRTSLQPRLTSNNHVHTSLQEMSYYACLL
jgi:hypothetical protein